MGLGFGGHFPGSLLACLPRRAEARSGAPAEQQPEAQGRGGVRASDTSTARRTGGGLLDGPGGLRDDLLPGRIVRVARLPMLPLMKGRSAIILPVLSQHQGPAECFQHAFCLLAAFGLSFCRICEWPTSPEYAARATEGRRQRRLDHLADLCQAWHGGGGHGQALISAATTAQCLLDRQALGPVMPVAYAVEPADQVVVEAGVEPDSELDRR